jgi:RNA-directed DNA polymerase
MFTVGLDIDTRAYFTAATMMDGDLKLLSIFPLLHPNFFPRSQGKISGVGFSTRPRLPTPWGDQLFSWKKIHERSICVLVKSTPSIMARAKTTVIATNLEGVVRSVLRLHHVSCSHITFILEAKATSGTTNHAGYNFSSSHTHTNRYRSKVLHAMPREKQTLVCRLENRRFGTSATLHMDKGVLEGTNKRADQLSDQRLYITSRGPRETLDPYFGTQIHELVKQINERRWPKGTLATSIESNLCLLQRQICYLSSTNNKDEALRLIDKYTFSVAVRFISIRKIRSQSGSVPGTDKNLLQTDQDCLDLLTESEWKNRAHWPQSEVRHVEIPKPNGKVRALGIGTNLDRVLQKALHLLLDPYYEALYPSDMYGFRKGRGALQAVGALKHITEQSRSTNLGILALNIKKCFDCIEHQYIMQNLDYPNRFEPLITRWLKPWIRSDNGEISERKLRGIAQGSILGPLICNVTLMTLLHGKGNANRNRPEIFSGLKQTKTFRSDNRMVPPPRNIYRHLIYYADDLTVTTTFPEELPTLYTNIDKALNPAGLELSSEKSEILDLRQSSHKKLSFDYMGFRFLYVPSSKIRQGGILTRNDDITARKKSQSDGTFLVYTSDKRFREIKDKCSRIVKKLTRLDPVSVINEINPVIRGHAQYFGWSNSFARLRMLEGLVFRAFKKYLIRKFKNRGMNRPTWVAANFLKCLPKRARSPHGLAWHVHVKLPPTASNKKRLKNYLFLVLPTKAFKIVQVKNAALRKDTRHIPYYTDPTPYVNHNLRLLQERRNDASFRDSLMLKQKGICPVCTQSLLTEHEEFHVTSEESLYGPSYLSSNNLEIHHKIPLAGKDLKTRIKLDKLDNLQLLHKSCHDLLTYTSAYSKSTQSSLCSGEPDAERLARPVRRE